MTDWSIEIEFLAKKLGMGAAHTVRAISTAMRDDPFEVLAYRGYGNGVKAHVYGRVVEQSGVTPSTASDSVITNLLNTYRRAESDPLRRAEVAVDLRGSSTDMVSDGEGFFGGWVTSEPADDTTEWHDYSVELRSTHPRITGTITGKGEILVPPRSSKFGVISDIDDTVIQSRVSSFIQAARTVMLGNARTRLPFAGVAAFYRALREGAGDEKNPIFYVSSSPWNIYDVISEFMELQTIPKGPILLRDWDISLSALAASHHFEHKLAAIRNVMQLYPEMAFVLIGDSSQHDPEIYSRIVGEFPDRVIAIYIRDVSRNSVRSASVNKLAHSVAQARSVLIMADDTLGAARHAVERGLIPADSLKDIGEEKRADEGETGAKVSPSAAV